MCEILEDFEEEPIDSFNDVVEKSYQDDEDHYYDTRR
jgi:hypothetical protein